MVEHLVVAQVAVGSSPIFRPRIFARERPPGSSGGRSPFLALPAAQDPRGQRAAGQRADIPLNTKVQHAGILHARALLSERGAVW